MKPYTNEHKILFKIYSDGIVDIHQVKIEGMRKKGVTQTINRLVESGLLANADGLISITQVGIYERMIVLSLPETEHIKITRDNCLNAVRNLKGHCTPRAIVSNILNSKIVTEQQMNSVRYQLVKLVDEGFLSQSNWRFKVISSIEIEEDSETFKLRVLFQKILTGKLTANLNGFKPFHI